MDRRRAVRIANCSGATGDGPFALRRVVKDGPVDIVTADYLAEMNIAWLALEQKQDPSKGYDPGFLRQLDHETAHTIAAKGIKVVHNGGALNPKGLAAAVEKQLASYGVTSLKIAYVEGDNVMSQLGALQQPGQSPHLDVQGRQLSDIKAPIVSANAYIGMGGIVAALEAGADIVICGRCCDASPVMGAAAWWHGWETTQWDVLAQSLIAGHILECGCYATGGNFSGFKTIKNNWDQGFPVAEIASDGTFDVFLQQGARGLVSQDTITAQLVYEIQGPYYLNPDVVADIHSVKITPAGKNRVTVSGITGGPPPPTTKLAICTTGGYQMEVFFFATGLDIAEKLADMRAAMSELVPNRTAYRVLRIDQYGTPQDDPRTEALGSCLFRVFAQADKPETFTTLQIFLTGYSLGGYCGLHLCMDLRMLHPRPIISYEPFTIPYEKLEVKAHVDGKTIPISPPNTTAVFQGQKIEKNDAVVDLPRFGPTMRVPLGHRVHARSGDKGSNANVGFWVASDEEHEWLRAFMTVDRMKALLGDEYSPEYVIELFELPNLRCVHFLVKGILEGGISTGHRVDGLAKSFGEFLRARHVDMPTKFLQQARL
ncbi:duf1446 domain-containing protein [Plectosphaerella plurivora]|uniref:Duf1446 domain-containing protein n=1 Tax=Plectosphaerella plurivora TaxID=936078 RepID=A0A9P8VDP9_9PEZI|nr:duf1446 domain-containing protein [Plectosphaerella plurivora]